MSHESKMSDKSKISFNKKLVGQNIRIEREKRNLSMDQFAKMMDISPPFLGLIERGLRGVTCYNLFKLNQLFDIDLNSLLVEDKKNSHKKDIKTKKIELTPISVATYIVNSLNEVELHFAVNLLESYTLLKGKINITEEDILKYFNIDLKSIYKDKKDEDNL